jgi:hypothetical protein
LIAVKIFNKPRKGIEPSNHGVPIPDLHQALGMMVHYGGTLSEYDEVLIKK